MMARLSLVRFTVPFSVSKPGVNSSLLPAKNLNSHAAVEIKLHTLMGNDIQNLSFHTSPQFEWNQFFSTKGFDSAFLLSLK